MTDMEMQASTGGEPVAHEVCQGQAPKPAEAELHRCNTASFLAAGSDVRISSAEAPVTSDVGRVQEVDRLIRKLLKERQDFEQAAADRSRQEEKVEATTRVALIVAFQLVTAAGDDPVAQARIKSEARVLGSNFNSRSTLVQHALDVAFPRAKDAPGRLTDSLRRLYAWAIRGAQLKRLTNDEFLHAVHAGGKRKAGIKALERFAKAREGKNPKSKAKPQSGTAPQDGAGAHAELELSSLEFGPGVHFPCSRLKAGEKFDCTLEVIDTANGRLFRVVALPGLLQAGTE